MTNGHGLKCTFLAGIENPGSAQLTYILSIDLGESRVMIAGELAPIYGPIHRFSRF